jgi:NitT/TauT family transport system permease protein
VSMRARRRLIELVLTISAPLLILAIWEALSQTKTIDPIFWPAPSTLWPTFTKLVQTGDLAEDVKVSTARILAGFLIGAIPGIILGLAMGLFWPVRVFVMPIATTVYAIPKIAVLPLVIIAFGTGETSKLAIIALSIFFLVVLNTMSGVMSIDPLFRDVAKNFGANRFELFYTVALPGALPAIFTGLRLAMGFALIVIIGTEFVSAQDRGIGHLVWQSWQTLAIKKMYVGLIVIGLMGWALTLLLDLLERVMLPWRTTT